MPFDRTRIAAASTVAALGALAAVALNAGGEQSPPQPAAAPKPVRTEVIRRTVRVTRKHPKPAPAPARPAAVRTAPPRTAPPVSPAPAASAASGGDDDHSSHGGDSDDHSGHGGGGDGHSGHGGGDDGDSGHGGHSGHGGGGDD
jgi:hypothetical protein